MTYRTTVIPGHDHTITGLVTLQFGPRDYDNYRVHLVRSAACNGTPGPTLCGVDRFPDPPSDGPGWFIGGGASGPDVPHTPCKDCADVARRDFRDLPIRGLGTPQIVACIAGTEEEGT